MINFLLSIFLYAAWTSVFSIGKLALAHSTPLFVTSVRMLLSAFILLGYLLFRKRKGLTLKKSFLLPILLLGVFSIYLTNICEFWGLQYLSSSKTCFIYSLSPFLTAFFSYLHFNEKMSPKKWIGMTIGLAGILPGLFLQSGQEGVAGMAGLLSWPTLSVLGAVVFSVYGWVLLRLLVKNKEISPVTANGYSMLFGGLLALVHSYLADTWSPVPVAAGSFLSFSHSILIMTFISNILCYNLYGYLLKRFTATLLSFIGLLSPFFASLSGWIILGEKPSGLLLLSTTIIISGLYLVYQEEIKQGYIKKKDSQKSAA